MEFSIRDTAKNHILAGTQSGQAIVEYILVLVVTVALILGGVAQLNGAFKAWAKNYFGDYLSCLLETGELPNISGAPGDPTTCNQIFKAFSLADGRPLIPASSGQKPSSGGAAAGGARESQARGASGPGNYNNVGGHFGGGSSGNGNSGGISGKRIGSDSIGTGNTGAGNYGGGYSATNRQNNTENTSRLDNRFAFDKESEDKQKRGFSVSSRAPSGDSSSSAKIQVHRKEKTKDVNEKDDSPMTFGNFIRFLIIAAIVIALIVLVGGQMLTVGKSME